MAGYSLFAASSSASQSPTPLTNGHGAHSRKISSRLSIKSKTPSIGKMTPLRERNHSTPKSFDNNKTRVIKNKLKMSITNNRERDNYRKMLLNNLAGNSKYSLPSMFNNSTQDARHGNSYVVESPPLVRPPIIMPRQFSSNYPGPTYSSIFSHQQSFHANKINSHETIADVNKKSLVSLVQVNQFSALSKQPYSPPPNITNSHSFSYSSKLSTTPVNNIKSELASKWTPGEKSNEFKQLISNNRFVDLLKPKESSLAETMPSASTSGTTHHDPFLIKQQRQHREALACEKKPLLDKFKCLLRIPSWKSFSSNIRSFFPYYKDDHQVQREHLYQEPKIIEKKREVLPQLTEEMKVEIREALYSSEMLVKAFNIPIYSCDLKTLLGHNWLNDNVMDFYFNLIAHRSNQPRESYLYDVEALPKVYVFSIFFYSRLIDGKETGRWLRKLNLLDYDLIYIPIILNSHWRLAVIDTERKVMQYYDSLGNSFSAGIQKLWNFFYEDVAKKAAAGGGCPIQPEEWKLIDHSDDIPLQTNSYDCGVFACKYAEYISRRVPITFDQSNISNFRQCMIYEILKMKLLT